MFISIPKEFFVPVLFRDRFILNSENNNMEYNTEKTSAMEARYRRIDEENKEEQLKVEKEMKVDRARDGAILDEADEEFVNSETAVA
ncbi:hypothetical protein [Clostridium gasigenes]|uniref:hypothetical protein n=1 Tax=Clostridium gasigenes TaxID=94869 RepID=UPI001C0E14A9|nr:hypothetical protein [Clostridium gasigenes]MBU3103280.1 hypothetical protein [Clostridium gasigenes]